MRLHAHSPPEEGWGSATHCRRGHPEEGDRQGAPSFGGGDVGGGKPTTATVRCRCAQCRRNGGHGPAALRAVTPRNWGQ